jgi:uncharacterized Zn-binding protein involved in type VI secretion
MKVNSVAATVFVPLLLLAAAVTTAAPAATRSAPPAAAAKRCTNGVSDRINGRVVCIHVGGKCVAAHNAKYRARGYACVNGRLRRIVKPSLSVGDASAAERNAGTTTLSVPVQLSAATTATVSVDYATENGTATAGSDYTAATGTLTFRPGEREKTIPVAVAGDTSIEPNETFAVALSNAVNATIAQGSATATIQNDDTAAAITPGEYQGAAQNGSYVFFTVTPDRAVTAFRANDLSETCDPGGIRITGGSDFGDSVFRIDAAGRFSAAGRWDGSDPAGDAEWTHWDAAVAGVFDSPTSVSGTIVERRELNYRGQHFRCSSGEIRWSATRRG